MKTFDGPLYRHRGAMLCLLPLVVLLATVIVIAPWRSNFDVDSMTHFEQIRSVSEHFSIGFDNGPVDAFAELRPRWFVAAHNKAWGILPATMAYLLAPAALLNGFTGVIRALWLLISLSALTTASLTHALTRKPYLAVASAWALVLGSSLGFWATMAAPFIPAGCLGLLAVAAGRHSVSAMNSRGVFLYGLAMGLCASLALGCHLLMAIPWGLMALITLGYGKPHHRALRVLSFSLASLPSLSLMAWVNHLRFNTYNPVSYGPCNSHTCTGTENSQTVHGFLEPLEPYRYWALAWLVALWCSRRSPRALALVVSVGLCAMTLPDLPSRDALLLYPRALWGFIIDYGSLSTGFSRSADLMASFDAGWAVRSLLQCSPWAIAAFFAARRPERANDSTDHATLALLSSIVLGVFTACALRANAGGPYVWGWPFLNPRYVVPALPALAVLSAVGAQNLPLRPIHSVIALAWAFYFIPKISSLPETDAYKHIVTLRWPLVLSILLTTFLSLSRKSLLHPLSRALAAIALSVSLAHAAVITLGIDRVATRDYRGRQDSTVTEVEHCISPHKNVILIGGYALDEAMVVRDRTNVLFINAGMGPSDGRNVLTLLNRYESPDRPAFIIQERPHQDHWHFRWPGWSQQERQGCPRVWRIVRLPRNP